MKKTWIILIVSVLALAAALGTAEAAPDPDGVLRLHVIASDDGDEAQRLKLLVRDRIVTLVSGMADGCESRAELLSRLDTEALAEEARAVLRENGCAEAVSVTLGEREFPDREYGGRLYPAGMYTALCVEIGKAGGKNWWCVLFPPLCFGRADRPVRSLIGGLFGW